MAMGAKALTFTVPAENESVSLSRSQVAQWMAGRLKSCADALLVLTELLTNAIEHGTAGCAVEVRVRCRAVGVEVRVNNEGGGVPLPQPEVAADEHGRGLMLVAGLSSQWSYLQRSTGPNRSITSAWAVVPYEPS